MQVRSKRSQHSYVYASVVIGIDTGTGLLTYRPHQLQRVMVVHMRCLQRVHV